MLNENILPLDIKTFLSQDKYRIPIYQRNYDWGEKETLQLIEDIADFASQKRSKKYYIGSAVVFARSQGSEDYFETIDGQQRLTTLTILVNVLKQMDEVRDKMDWFKRANLSYDHREEADEAIRLLTEGKFSTHPSASNIYDVYRIIKKNLLKTLEDKNVKLSDFVDYFLNNVIIMRIPVPRDTDLNHYFEIMNSRGEQLEKHEVLKACLMDNLDKDKATMCLFNDIWEACSDMSSYVQMNMKPTLRRLFFTETWNKLRDEEFDFYVSEYRNMGDNDDSFDNGDEYKCRSLAQLFIDAEENVKYELPGSDNEDDGDKERFGTIVNFPNFLLQTLKVMCHFENPFPESVFDEIKLDDKRLIDIFQMVLSSCLDKRDFVKRFVVTLLRMRNLFDSFVIKRENYNGKEAWSLKSPKLYAKSKVNYVGTFSDDENEDDLSKDIRMLEAMFHVSAPTQIYKHWLNAVLLFAYGKYKDKNNVRADELRDNLYKLACTYMLDRYLCENKTDFEKFIFVNHFNATNNTIQWNIIDNGCNVENFVFNFYDYVTWKNNPNKYSHFEFTYRTSVEHFYPQHPVDGNQPLDDASGLNDFGNLCLISRGMNSKFSNNMPKAKYDNFGKGEGVNELSLKLNEMFEIVRDKGDWGTEEIKDFEHYAHEKLYKAICEGCEQTITLG